MHPTEVVACKQLLFTLLLPPSVPLSWRLSGINSREVRHVLGVPSGAFRHQRYRTVLAFSDFEGWVNDQGQKYQRRHGLDAPCL